MRLKRFPKVAVVTFEGVRVDSVRFWPVRMASYLYVTTSVPEAVAAVTVSVAALLVTLPAELVAVTVNLAPLSPSAASVTV